jgi:DNA-directed RNA polymerase subunit RPC12/RpoP
VEDTMAQTYSGEFYCVKCKAKVEATGEVVVSATGRKTAKATCPTCGTKLTRFLPKD